MNTQVTGMGLITPLGIGISECTNALKNTATSFECIKFTTTDTEGDLLFPIAKVNNFIFKDKLLSLNIEESILSRASKLRHVSVSTQFGIYCALEAWRNSNLDVYGDLDFNKVAIVSCGTNTQQSTIIKAQDDLHGKLQFMNPNYGLTFYDTDIIGVLSEILQIQGEGFSIGAASASGNMGIIQAARLIQALVYDIVIVVAPLMDLSVYEFQGFTALGAMAKLNKYEHASELCKPFDKQTSGFVYGQSAGCLILESEEHLKRRGGQSYGSVAGYGLCLDSNRNPNPTLAGEIKAMNNALTLANILPQQVDYINTHGTGSPLGDQIEAQALVSVGFTESKVNSTKSLIGHALSAAGLVESIFSLIQMNESFLHSCHNLINPINNRINFILDVLPFQNSTIALSNSFGFGGINTSLVLKKSV